MALAVIRVIGRLLLPVSMPLPRRHWRWLWLAMALKATVAIPLFLVLAIPYLAAHGVTRGCDALGSGSLRAYVRCYNADLRRSGWRPEKRLSGSAEIIPPRRRSA